MKATVDNTTQWTPAVGDSVSLPWGLGRVKGKITENRGPLGGNGRTLWGVRAFVPPAHRFYTELLTDEMQPLPVVQRAKRVPLRRKAAAR